MNHLQIDQSTSFLPGFPANPTVSPGSEKARRMTAISGMKFFPLLNTSSPLGACLKTLLGSSRWGSTECLLTWRGGGTPANRSLFRLVPSVPHTKETGYGLLPTPNAIDGFRSGMETLINYHNAGHQKKLSLLLQRKGYMDSQIVEKYEEVMGYPKGWTELNPAETR